MCMCYQPDNSDRPPPTTQETGLRVVKTEKRKEYIESGRFEQVENQKERVIQRDCSPPKITFLSLFNTLWILWNPKS